MTEGTQQLLSALNALDNALVEIVVKLLADTLTPNEHRRFGDRFIAVGQMLHERGKIMESAGNGPERTPAGESDNRGDDGG